MVNKYKIYNSFILQWFKERTMVIMENIMLLREDCTTVLF